MALNLPFMTPEPIEGDSLTQYLRSLTNLGGSGSTQFLNAGMGMTDLGGSIAGGRGVGQLETAFNTTLPAQQYWQSILSGDPKALTAATAPTANALSTIFSGAT